MRLKKNIFSGILLVLFSACNGNSNGTNDSENNTPTANNESAVRSSPSIANAEELQKLNIVAHKYRDVYDSVKSGMWSLVYPDNKFGVELKYSLDEKAYAVETVSETLKENGKRERDGYLSSISSPSFSLNANKNYQIVLRMKADTFPKGQNIMVVLSGPKGDTKSKWETLWNVSKANIWEEIYIPVNPSTISNPQGDTWKVSIFSSLAFGAYENAANILISEDIDIFELPKGKELVATKDIDFIKDKKAFESSFRRVDELGNFYVKNNNGWEHIFPKMIYRNDHRSDHLSMFKDYKAYGFDGVVDISTPSQIGAAIEAGLENLSLPLHLLKDKTSGLLEKDTIMQYIQELYNYIDENNLDSKIIWHNNDNENTSIASIEFQDWIANFIDTHNIDPQTHYRKYPIFYLNGKQGLPRTYLNSLRKVMDITGTYIGRDLSESYKDGKKDLSSKLLTQFLAVNQKAPASVIQLQKHFGKKFVPSLFYGIIQGGRALSVWRDGQPSVHKHSGDKLDMKDTYWAPAFRDYVSAELDALLPLLQQPHYTSWTATTNAFPEVRMGTRELNGVRYLILANFADSPQKVTVDLNGYQASEALDYFNNKSIASINNAQFTFTLDTFNHGYRVIRILKNKE